MFGKKEYKISLSEDWVTPEETLIDSGSEHSDLERPISHNAFRFTFFAAIILLGLVFAFSFKIAVSEHKEYARIAFENKSVNFFIPPPRGIIFDRLGKPLVRNLASFDLLVISKEIREDQNRPEWDKIADILKTSRDEFARSVDESARNQSVFFAAKDLAKDQVLELRYLNPKGFYIVPDTNRRYIDGHQFSSVVGYVGKVNKEDLNDDYYRPTDVIGRLGVELQYEEILRGEHGKIFFSKNTEEKLNIDPVPGRNLVLNIDYDLQKKLYNELYGALAGASLQRGAAIIQNPYNGQVLAMVSFPTYDNNLIVSGLSEKDYKKLFESKSRPLFNRVVGGLYNPGSTIKPFIGLMTLQENIFTPKDVIRDCIRLVVPNPFDPDSPSIFKNWREDTGLFNLRRAIAESCNIYFFIAGGGFGDIPGLGIERIAKYLISSWADKLLGIDLPGEVRGFVPTPDWKEKNRGEPWYQGDTYNVSIGQGDLLVTPLWLNSYISAIANGGNVWRPQIAQRTVDDKKNDIDVFSKEQLFQLPFSAEVLAEVKRDMQETVMSGTAKLLQNLPVKSGAKTGTAEVIKGQSVNALFTAFAPFDNPELAITILVEGASSNQGVAVVVADKVMKWYFERSLGIESSPEPEI
jgi:penicillin-binding protein 2